MIARLFPSLLLLLLPASFGLSWEAVGQSPYSPGRRNAQVFCGESQMLLFGGRGQETRLGDTWALPITGEEGFGGWAPVSGPGQTRLLASPPPIVGEVNSKRG